MSSFLQTSALTADAVNCDKSIWFTYYCKTALAAGFSVEFSLDEITKYEQIALVEYGDNAYVAEKVKTAYAANINKKASFRIPPWYQQGTMSAAEKLTKPREDVLNDFYMAARIRYGVVQPVVTVS